MIEQMSKRLWKPTEELISLFQAIGKASLTYDIQDSHSGNMAIRWRNEDGEERIVITSTGSQKGDLEKDKICFLSTDRIDYGYYKASSETEIHARILSIPGVWASMHAHTKELTIATLDDEEKPASPEPFIPIDALGYHYLEGLVPVDWFEVPSGSKEMVEKIPKQLMSHPVTVTWGHGAFARGRNLKEAFFLLCVANNSGYIVNIARRVGIDVDGIRGAISKDANSFFSYPFPEYEVELDDVCDFPEDEEIVREFKKAGARIFESRLSPFHTGSISMRAVDTILFAPKASMPREIGGPLLELPLKEEDSDSFELKMHKRIYAQSNFQTIMHCFVPEAEALSWFIYPGEDKPVEKIIPVDAEGSFLYLVIPVLPPKPDFELLLKLLHDYKVVIVRGNGVWAVGHQSISEVLHHPSSVREICIYRIGAIERGLDLRKMEPKKAKRW